MVDVGAVLPHADIAEASAAAPLGPRVELGSSVGRETSATTNTVATLRGTGTGYMDPNVTPVQVSPVDTNWNAALPAMVGDVNGDHNADVVWVISGSTTQVFVALSKGNAPGS